MIRDRIKLFRIFYVRPVLTFSRLSRIDYKKIKKKATFHSIFEKTFYDPFFHPGKNSLVHNLTIKYISNLR